MQVIQKKGSNKHTFDFKDEIINFGYEDKTGSGDSDFYYSDIPKKSSVRIEQNDWLKNVGFLWLILGAFQVGLSLYTDSFSIAKTFWAFLGTVCLAWFYLTKVKYTVFQTERGGIFVIQGKDHEKIIDEIMARRNRQLLDWYGNINYENDPEKEKSKFKWLCEQGVISSEDMDIKIAQIESFRLSDSSYSAQSLN